MSLVGSVQVDLAVHLGSTMMPVHQLLRMGRGAVIELETVDGEIFTLYANTTPVALGEVVVEGDRIRLKVTQMLRRAVEAR